MEFYSSISEACLSVQPLKSTQLSDIIELEDMKITAMSERMTRTDEALRKCINDHADQTLMSLSEVFYKDNQFVIPCIVVPNRIELQKSETFWNKLASFLTTNKVAVQDLSGFFGPSASNHSSFLQHMRRNVLGPSDCQNYAHRKVGIIIHEINNNDVKFFEMLVKTLISSKYSSQFTVFVGISTFELFEFLHIDVSNHIAIECLNISSTKVQLSKLFCDLFVDVRAPERNWKLGSRVVTFLVNRFLSTDLNVNIFVQAVKLCMIEDVINGDENMVLLEGYDAPSEQHKKINFLVEIFLEVAKHQARCNYFHSVGSFTVYEVLVSGKVLQSELWRSCSLSIHSSEEDVIQSYLHFLIEKCSELELYEEKTALLDILNASAVVEDNDIESEMLCGDSKFLDNAKPRKIRTHNLREVLQKSYPGPVASSKTSSKLVSFLEKLLRQFKNGFNEDEDRVFNKDAFLREYYASSHRLIVSQSLMNPSKYLKCNCCKDAVGAQELLPDSSLLYFLLSEIPGMYINMFDFLSSFLYVLDQEPKTGKSSKKAPKSAVVDEMSYVRFLQALSNLQFVGYLKVSKRRKSEQIVKLTWNAI